MDFGDLYISRFDLDTLYVNGEDLTNLTKVGRSIKARTRIASHAFNPFPLKVLHIERDAGKYEHLIHRKLDSRRYRWLQGKSKEWFLLHGDPVEQVLRALTLVKQELRQARRSQSHLKAKRFLQAVPALPSYEQGQPAGEPWFQAMTGKTGLSGPVCNPASPTGEPWFQAMTGKAGL